MGDRLPRLDRLPKLELWEQAVALAGIVILALISWVIARLVGQWLQGKTHLGLRGLHRLAAPLTLLIWVVAGWLAFRETEKEHAPSFDWLFEAVTIGAGFWLAARALDVAWETGRASARLRAQPAATAGLLAAKLLGKTMLFLLAVTVIAVRLGAAEQLYLALGAIGASLAFAAREPISDAFAFVQLTLNPPFRMGDWVRVGDFRGGDTVEGEVVAITLAAVTIRSRRRSEISISNTLFHDLRIENLSATDRRRLVLVLPIASGLNAEKLRLACERIEEDMKHSRWVSNVRPPRVWISGYSEGLTLKVSVWLHRRADRRKAQRDLFLQIQTRFEEVMRS